ncbi:MAG: RES family NAD+ phosphorylase [Bryobacteraceae bacterium]|jgi:hypothetical protein
MTNNKSTGAPLVDSFVGALCEKKDVCWPWYILTRRIGWIIVDELATAWKAGLSITAFRAREFHGGQTPASPRDIYWTVSSWREHVRRGSWQPERYDETGERVLYLSTTPETALREAKRGTDPVYLQRFQLDLPTTKTVTLGHDLEQRAPHLHFLLLSSEYPREGSRLQNPYRATHFLSYACAVLRIDAIEYPSVRVNLKDHPTEFNLVLFRRAVDAAEGMMTGDPFLYPETP